MAGAGYKLFSTGDVLTATDVNTYLMQQTVMVFDDAAARTTALSGVVAEGMLSYLKDTNAVEVYDGANWVSSDDPNAIQNTIVAAKGDIIGASANDVPAVTSVGADGETLVADSSTSTGLSYQANFAAGKNKIINGAFDNWQRGTSFSGLADGAYFADRFAIAFSAGGASNTASQQTFTPGAAPVAGYEGQFFGRVAATSGGASTVLGISQKVENVRTLAGQTFTFSFYAKADSARTVTSYLIQNFGSGGSASVVNTTTFALTTSWARYSYTATMPSVSGKTIGTGSYFYIDFELAAGQATGSPVLDTWGWQLEAGSTATAFQTATGTIQGELAACQRYYFRTTVGADGITPFQGAAYSTTAAYGIMNAKVTMRTIPSSVDYSNVRITDAITNYTITNLALWSIKTEDALGLLATGASGLTQYRPYTLGVTASGGYLGLSAEL